jgi:diguanylate cyclase (GGDEF)-like protein
MPTELIVSTQLLLYGVSWFIAAILIPQERKCLGNWAAYALFQGLSGYLFVKSGMAFGSLTLTFAIIFNILGFYAAMRGIEAYATEKKRLDQWLLGPVVVTITILLLTPIFTHDLQLIRRIQGLIYAILGVLILLGSAPYLWIHLRKHHGKIYTCIGLLPGVFMGLTALAQMIVLILGIQIDAEQTKKLGNDNLLGAMLATGLFNLAYVFLFISRMVKQLRDSAQLDFLTGTLNRRECDSRLQQAWQLYKRNNSAFLVALLDIDNFKKINDSHGHALGDECIKLIAHTIKTEIRAYDIAGRWGGEEFILIFPECDLLQAEILCNRLRGKISEIAHKELNIELTASIGIASASSIDTSPEQLLARADAALYRAKAEGRNRVVCSN